VLWEIGQAIGFLDNFQVPLPVIGDEGSPSQQSAVALVCLNSGGMAVNIVPSFTNGVIPSTFSGAGLQASMSYQEAPATFKDFLELNVGESLSLAVGNGFGAIQIQDSLVAIPDPLAGDFDNDGDVDADDIDFYNGNLGQPASFNVDLDLNSDNSITLADHDLLVTTFVQTSNGVTGALIGDVDLNGDVDVLGDAFQLVENLGGVGSFTYSDGDLNADGNVDVLGDAFRLVANLGMSNLQ